MDIIERIIALLSKECAEILFWGILVVLGLRWGLGKIFSKRVANTATWLILIATLIILGWRIWN
jgi:hypothetical protein